MATHLMQIVRQIQQDQRASSGGDHIKKPEAQKEMLAAVPSASRII